MKTGLARNWTIAGLQADRVETVERRKRYPYQVQHLLVVLTAVNLVSFSIRSMASEVQ
ncbi:hypothetical protein GY45DRAFT_1327062 [Cubamyces sp. BRFM 1775]|nr:hypothetical protein GY45DRAFT_1327062 [Cubamyces sp. BRFM 1775]